MKILGINGSGWLDVSHDSAVALVIDGKLICAAEEERFTRNKRAYDALPLNAIHFCLNQKNLVLDDIDYIVFGWDWKKYGPKDVAKDVNEDYMITKFFRDKNFKYSKKPKIKFVEHHLAHAASTFRCSGFNNAGILIIDGQGEYCSASIWRVENNKLIKVWHNDVTDSLGFFYGAVCRYIGMKNGDEGKLMGLAPYGQPQEQMIKQFESIDIKLTQDDLLRRSGQQRPIVEQWMKEFEKEFGSKDNTDIKFNKFNGTFSKAPKFTELQKDIAASAQKFLELKILELVDKTIELTNCSKLCIAGGVGLNCVANGRILENNKVKEMYVQPASNDAGIAIGAALELATELGESANEYYDHSYFGPSFTNEEIESELQKYKIKYHKVENISKICAKLLSENKIIGWFQGGLEFGPRALGNRSILANPINREMADKVNITVKSREVWRPFAPSLLAESAKEYFELDHDFPFMIISSKVKEDKRNKIPSVVHVDGTSRPHTVKKKINPKYYELIKEFEKLTGVPVILNTSFNGGGEPIVCSPKDAIRTFYSTGLEYLAIGDYLIEK